MAVVALVVGTWGEADALEALYSQQPGPGLLLLFGTLYLVFLTAAGPLGLTLQTGRRERARADQEEAEFTELMRRRQHGTAETGPDTAPHDHPDGHPDAS